MNIEVAPKRRTNVLRRRQKKLFITDCEGPISKNDNAYELTEHFIPDGPMFFALISKYDDVQADIIKRQGYKSGDTLKLILPFLKAHGATNKKIGKFSAEHILLVPSARDTLRFIQGIMSSFIVSTSYEQYTRALCSLVDFPYENVYCTKLNIDKYRIDKKEIEKLKQLEEEITEMPMIHIPENASSLNDLSVEDQKTVRRLDEIFWEEISAMECDRMLNEVNPIGGFEKAEAVRGIERKTDGNLFNTMYIGDSITDVQSFRLVRENGGLTVSFNGNSYAIREAEIAVLSDNTIVTSVLADVFNRLGRDYVTRLVEEWSYPAVQRYCTPALGNRISEFYPRTLPKVEIITFSNKERLVKESTSFRKTVRGEAIGALG
jgi:energy-converting hydrogenase A subunit R